MDSVQVNHITARDKNVLCVALMNESNRELRVVTVQLDLPTGSYPGTV